MQATALSQPTSMTMPLVTSHPSIPLVNEGTPIIAKNTLNGVVYMPIDRRLMRFCRHIYRRGANDSGEYFLAEIYLAMNSTAEFCGLRRCIGESVFCQLDNQLVDSSFANSPQGLFTRLVMYLQTWVKVRRQGDELLSLSPFGEEGLEDAILESIYPCYYGNTPYPGYWTMSVSFPFFGGSALRVDKTPLELLELIRAA